MEVRIYFFRFRIPGANLALYQVISFKCNYLHVFSVTSSGGSFSIPSPDKPCPSIYLSWYSHLFWWGNALSLLNITVPFGWDFCAGKKRKTLTPTNGVTKKKGEGRLLSFFRGLALATEQQDILFWRNLAKWHSSPPSFCFRNIEDRYVNLVRISRKDGTNNVSQAQWVWSELFAWRNAPWADERCKIWHQKEPNPSEFKGTFHFFLMIKYEWWLSLIWRRPFGLVWNLMTSYMQHLVLKR